MKTFRFRFPGFSIPMLFWALNCCYFQLLAQNPLPLVPEICDNGLDDDGDGLVDCYDITDCDCTPLPACSDSLRGNNFAMQLAWQSNISAALLLATAPIVGNLNPGTDSIPEILLPGFVFANGVIDKIHIFKGDGSNKNSPATLNMPSNLRTDFQQPPVISIADVNADGNPELLVIGEDKKIRLFNSYNPAANPVMQLWITSKDTCSLGQYNVYTADFDQDGIAEIYAGTEVFVLDFSIPGSPQLVRRLLGAGSQGRVDNTYPTLLGEFSSYAADLLDPADCNGDPDCLGLEIAAGNMIYSVDLDPNDGDGYQIKVQRNLNVMTGINFSDGFTAVADLNLDNIPELIVTGRRGIDEGFYIWNKTGYSYFFPSNGYFLSTPNGSGFIGGLVSVANVYDDRKNGWATDYPEIVAYDINLLSCYNLHAAAANPAAPYWWKADYNMPHTGGNIHTVSLFDFDQNGEAEVVYQRDTSLSVVYGGAPPFPAGTGALREWFSTSGFFSDGYSYPLVADVDADGHAEIVTVCNTGPFLNGVCVFEAEEITHSTWPSARQVWNQYAYSGVNVNDDLTIPKVQQKGHLELPGPGSKQRPLNTFLAQTPLLDWNHEAYFPAADATMEVLEVACLGNLQFAVTIRVCNEGTMPLPANLPVTFYKTTNPTVGPAAIMNTVFVSNQPILPGQCAVITTSLPFTGADVYAVANDPGIGVFPLTDSEEFWKAECDYSNNTAKFKMNPTIGPSLNLGPDIKTCTATTVTLQAGPNFSSYKWQNGSTNSFFFANGPGVYWVETKDHCLNTKRDTVIITLDTVLQQVKTAACAGSTFQFAGVDIPAGTNKTFVFTGVNGCDSTIVVQVAALPQTQSSETQALCPGDSILVFGNFVSSAGVYSKTLTGANGCDSLHSITVQLLPAPVPSTEILQICPGDSITIFGNIVTAAGIYSKAFSNVNGCDSLHTVTVQLLPAPAPSTETLQICPGDSVTVFGNIVTAAGVFSKAFSNVNGCDSMHTVTVQLLPAPVPSTESLQICPGDSVTVFGNIVTAAGVFTKTFSNVNGCDSLHTVTVQLLPAPIPTSETQQICPGDSVTVFGNIVTTAGVFTKAFSNVNGCDSLHTVTVQLFPAPVPGNETQQICPGDSVTVFGNIVTSAGVFSKTFSNVNGCDSLHTVTVQLLPAPVPSSETQQICPGDSVTVFGNIVTTAGVFSKTFSNVNGCDSMHTVTVQLLPAPVPSSETLQICPGDSVTVFGNIVTAAGNYSKAFSNINGCDSLHTVTVQLLPAPVPSSETLQICPGDSVTVFGNIVTAAGNYTKAFSNGSGCDSLHTVTVQLLPAPVPSTETLQICPGDSVTVFGNVVTTAGVFSKAFSNVNGCDSLHTVTVQLLPAPNPSFETLQICTGDSITVFGNIVTTAGIFSKVFSNVNGCDSMHTVTVQLFPAPVPGTETRQICPGDSTLVFGTFVQTEGTYSQTLSNASGCDSLHTITVTVSAEILLTDSLSICPGDSVQVLGEWINQPGVYNQVVSSPGGCDSVWTITVQGIALLPVKFDLTQPTQANGTGLLTITELPAGALFSLDNQQYSAQTEFSELAPGQYVLFTQQQGCTTQSAFEILQFAQRDSTVYAPNVFSPDSGGENGNFSLFAPPGLFRQILWFKVFDRWGNQVFEQKNAQPNEKNGWDGTYKGQMMSPGVYVWEALFEYPDGSTYLAKGDITLLR